ncbi:hypothetical protein CBR_g55439 [Chara braunii]|uniref:Uncharacterized protein n=1 Tax=Chara braunii TaxID=69332 RepID=A0A388K7U2_CHABU|nr:hypothetical protein CBR_g55439 [Chara braunii]|eukprot:GBG66096.1 hypothetical protein CBR_g55439 [Chara braunii]
MLVIAPGLYPNEPLFLGHRHHRLASFSLHQRGLEVVVSCGLANNTNRLRHRSTEERVQGNVKVNKTPKELVCGDIQTLQTHSKMMKRLLRCEAKTFCFSRESDVEIYPLIEVYVETFRKLVTSLDMKTQDIIHCMTEWKGPSVIRTLGSRKLTNIRGEIAHDVFRVFWIAAGLLYPGGSVRDRLDVKQEEMRKRMTEDSLWRIKDNEP